MQQRITEGELIEAERRVLSPIAARCEERDDFCVWDRVLQTLRRLIQQERDGQLCCECGARIVPYTESVPSRTKAPPAPTESANQNEEYWK
jgi:hypothetical protein